MTEKDLLEKIIAKAGANGYQWSTQYFKKRCLELGVIEPIIFDHSFCKSFFGEDRVCIACGGINGASKNCKYTVAPEVVPAWQYHIAQLALAEDRLKYLELYI